MTPNDQQIIDLCRRGRSDGFSMLLMVYQERVYRRAYSFVRNRDDALDVTQDVFLRTIRGIQAFTPGRPLWPWLRRITTNLCLNFLRDRHPTLSLDLEDQNLASGADPAEAAMAAWSWQQVEEAMSRLPPLWRMALVLRHEEDLPYDEVARAMDLPLGTVKTYLFRGRQALKQALGLDREG